MTIQYKKITFGIISAGVLLGAVAVQVHAQTATPTFTTNQQIRQDIKNDRKDIRQDLKNLRQANKGKFTHLVDAVVTAINGSSLTVSKNGKSYTVNTDGNTKFRRRFWGASNLGEISVNDHVNVWGVWADDAKTTITARLIRDTSIQKRRGVFIGTISSLSSNGFVLASKHRGNQTVTVSSSTKYIGRNEVAMSFSNLKTGDRVRVRGLWDKTNSTITEVTEVKDFSFPKMTPKTTP